MIGGGGAFTHLTMSTKDPYEGLSEESIAILKAQTTSEPVNVNYRTLLLRYATPLDKAEILVSYVFSACAGACLPLFTLIFGSMTNEFVRYFVEGATPAEFGHQINYLARYFIYLFAGIFAFSFLETYMHVQMGEKLTGRIRAHYLEAIMRQNIGFFDKVGAGEITNRITTDTNLIQEGISEKAGLIVSSIAAIISAFIIGFIKSWKLTLIMMSSFFALLFAMTTAVYFVVKFAKLAIVSDAKASSVAEEVLGAIRNVVAFGTQDRLTQKYDDRLVVSMKYHIFRGRGSAAAIASVWTIAYLNYALSFWEGSRLVSWGQVNVGNIMTVLFAVMIGAVMVGNVAPNLQAMGSAIASGQKIFETIDWVPPIDSFSDEGQKLDQVHGHIQLEHVNFRYPSRPDVSVLHDFSLEIKPGQTVALVGASGSGKSTIIGILERFYEILGGKVTIDGVDISSLNVRWLRQQLALVSQEPTLFGVSIYENIAYGLIGTPHENADPEKKRQLVEDAARQANAYDFIQDLTDGFETNVGDRGFLLSGGQKQRIAIARAIVREPKILLLDEATSALDTKSEGIVQDALDKAAADRTTIVIAHRLSTVKNADLIVVMNKGSIVEQGTHHELIEQKGMYFSLVNSQTIMKQNDDGSDTAADDKLEEDVVAIQSLTMSSFSEDEEEYNTKEQGIIEMIRFVYSYNKEETTLLLIGGACAFVGGIGYPGMAVIFAKCIEAFMTPPSGYPHMRSLINTYTGLFFMIAMIEMVAFYVEISILTLAGERLVRKLRLAVFKQFLRMDIGFFDREENTTGSLTSNLGKDAHNVRGLSGTTFGQILVSIVTVVAGFVVSVVFNWRMGLICGACIPILIGCGFCRYYVLTWLNNRAKLAYEQSGSYACENTNAIRTVTTLTREYQVYKTYKESVEGQVQGSKRPIFFSSILFGLSQSLSPLIMGLAFWYGGILLKHHTISPFRFFVAFIAIVFGSQSAGSIFTFAPDMSKAAGSTRNIMNVLAVEPEIDWWSDQGTKIDPKDVKGNIEFQNVHFRYPTRMQVPVLRGLNLSIKQGQYVALVGSSGCGKSTTVGLLECFYRPTSGKILLDGLDLADLNINSYREAVALVQQEPILFSGTIKENILLGTQDPDVTDEVVYEAARKSNIHDFIMSLPEGYDTVCGSKGSLLSGGQKQRIAIARALIRNPKILLLDEATSALDSESEKVVQAALDAAAKGRTTIAIAHRLSTIQNADVIFVFENGVVLESGTHQQLLANRSKYYELVKLQALEG